MYLYYPWSLNWTWTHQKLMKLWNRLWYMKLINICHLLCFNCKMQGKMLTLRVFTALANQTVAVLLIPVFSPLCLGSKFTMINDWWNVGDSPAAIFTVCSLVWFGYQSIEYHSSSAILLSPWLRNHYDKWLVKCWWTLLLIS